MTNIGGGIEVRQATDLKGRPHVLITQIDGGNPMGAVKVTHASHLQALIRALKARLDVILEDTRARARPEACHGGGKVPRRPALDEGDGA